MPGQPGRNRGRIFTRDTYSGHYLASTVTLHTYLFSVISRRQQQHSREWQRQQPLDVSCPRALTLCNSIILYVNSCACYSSAAATIDKKTLVSWGKLFFPNCINKCLKNWYDQLTRLWLSILGEWAVNDLCDVRQKAEGQWQWFRRWLSALISTILS